MSNDAAGFLFALDSKRKEALYTIIEKTGTNVWRAVSGRLYN